MDYRKVKSASKHVEINCRAIVARTLKTIADIVGATLGPGGQPVLIERYEHGLPPMVTKDGVTVFRALGFDDPRAHCVMEAARDAAGRTASEAGDGTTTATILAEAIVRRTAGFCAKNPRVSPRSVVSRLEKAFREDIEPAIRRAAIKANLNDEAGWKLLHSVAQVSANGDVELADAVMECFRITGDDGNVTIVEANGPSGYPVDEIDGYPIGVGYEESAMKFYPKFINDPGRQMTVMEKPIFCVYHGQITEFQTILHLLKMVGEAWVDCGFPTHNLVIVATGFSETVLGSLALNFSEATTLNAFPLLAPQSPVSNGQAQFLEDVCAVTGAIMFDPLNKPLDQARMIDLGNVIFADDRDSLTVGGVRMFEATRFRSTIVGFAAEDLLLERVDELKTLASNPESELDRILIQERIAKLTGGIARLKVVGASNGEMKEKRDRAEDAVCAVRGAIKSGCLPGGGWALQYVVSELAPDRVLDEVLAPALLEPVHRLFENAGIVDPDEYISAVRPMTMSIMERKAPVVYDVLAAKHVDAVEGGILDSVPAVLEAIRNSISIATLLGSLGGIVVFQRDSQLERDEARATRAFLQDANTNPADERA